LNDKTQEFNRGGDCVLSRVPRAFTSHILKTEMTVLYGHIREFKDI